MTFKIHDGSSVDIKVGSKVVVIPGFLPKSFDGKFIDILEVTEQGPSAQLEPDQLSVISPEIITIVI